ncbi:hypothetical protein PN454_07380 [Nodularia spumigena CS-591/07A]|nr:hypothetical protein [Nodularia spumigena CS-591/07A]
MHNSTFFWVHSELFSFFFTVYHCLLIIMNYFSTDEPGFLLALDVKI